MKNALSSKQTESCRRGRVPVTGGLAAAAEKHRCKRPVDHAERCDTGDDNSSDAPRSVFLQPTTNTITGDGSGRPVRREAASDNIRQIIAGQQMTVPRTSGRPGDESGKLFSYLPSSARPHT